MFVARKRSQTACLYGKTETKIPPIDLFADPDQNMNECHLPRYLGTNDAVVRAVVLTIPPLVSLSVISLP